MGEDTKRQRIDFDLSESEIDHVVEVWENLTTAEKIEIGTKCNFNWNIQGHKTYNVLKPLIQNRKKILEYAL